MEYTLALTIANKLVDQLRPHCTRIEIAGSVRRKKPEVKDIEIVCIPKPYSTDPLFPSGIAPIVNQWQNVKGELPCKYTQRVLPEGIKLDLFMVEPGNWGLQLAIRTGSADYSHKVLASTWAAKGYKSIGGYLYKGSKVYEVREERDLFERLGIEYTEPENRNI